MYRPRALFLWALSFVPGVRGYARNRESVVFRGAGGRPAVNGKTAVIGLPKSGNNWLLYLLADSLGLETVHPWRPEDRDKAGVTIFHKPLLPTVLYKQDLARAVYILRDLRDVIVSYFHYAQTDDYRKYVDSSVRFDDIDSFYFQYFVPMIVPRYDWLRHAERYVGRGLPVIKYEDLYDDPRGQLTELFRHWGLTVAPEAIEAAVAKNTLDKLKETGRETWRPVAKTHFRKGGYGGYVDVLTDAVLKDIDTRFGAYLTRWGYGGRRSQHNGGPSS